jgi:hypothetical protein
MTRPDQWHQFLAAAHQKGRAVSATEMAQELCGDASEAAVQTAKDIPAECVDAGLLSNWPGSTSAGSG